MIEDGVNPELILGHKYSHLPGSSGIGPGQHRQQVDLGEQYQMVLELRPAHDPFGPLGIRRRGG